MRLALLIFSSLIYSNTVFADISIHVFYDHEISIPDSCYFIVRGGEENDFTCPTPNNRFRSITFQTPIKTQEQYEKFKSDLDNLNEMVANEGLDLYHNFTKSRVIDEKTHYLTVSTMYGKRHHSYAVCDHRSCIKFFAYEVGFIQRLIAQFSKKSLYDFE